ncbi:MAG: phosphatidate cytidylyltransferase [bacterium]
MSTGDISPPTPPTADDSGSSGNETPARPADAERHGEEAEPVKPPHPPSPTEEGAGRNVSGGGPSGKDAGGEVSGRDVSGKGGNFVLRLATGLPAFGGVLALIVWGPGWIVAALVAVVSVMATEEFRRLVGQGNGVDVPAFPLLSGAALIGLGGVSGEPALLGASLAAACVIYLGAVWFHAPDGGEQALDQAAYGLACLVLVPWLLNHAPMVLTLPQGSGLLVFLLLTVSANDSWAYLAGTAFGKIPLIPGVSPNKTVEGAVAGLAGGATSGLVAGLWLEGAGTPLAGFIYWDLIAVGLALALAAQAGDLLESKLKRLARADHSGGVGLPGHGGVLDRADGYLIAGPLFYYFYALTFPW